MIDMEALRAAIAKMGREDAKLTLKALQKAELNVATNDTSQERVDKTSESVHEAQRTWVGLTDEELPPLVGDNGKYMELQQVRRFYKYIEAKLKEKNT